MDTYGSFRSVAWSSSRNGARPQWSCFGRHVAFPEMAVNSIADLLRSPDFYPLQIDQQKRSMRFVRMSRASYRDSVFLDLRLRHMGEILDLKLDDLLLQSGRLAAEERPVHYILHISFCCSTLLARYFELLPNFFVLKEPRLLAQLAVSRHLQDIPWDEWFDLTVKLLSRTYDRNEIVVMKPNDWVNPIGCTLLRHNPRATSTFLMAPLKAYMLSILKSEERRGWVRERAPKAAADVTLCPQLAGVDPSRLAVPEAIAYLWLAQRFVCGQMTKEMGDRMVVMSGDDLAQKPRSALQKLTQALSLPVEEKTIEWATRQPSVQRYSKDLSRPYDAESRVQEQN